MANYQQYNRYTVDTRELIDSFVAHRGSQAPKLEPTPQETPQKNIKVRKPVGIKSKEQIAREKSYVFCVAVRVAFVSVLCFALAFFCIHSMAIKNQLTREIAQAQVDIAIEESNYVSLQSQLNSMVSMSMIDKYAVEKLGMTKMRSNQIQYINVDAFKAKQQDAAAAEQNKKAPVKDAAKGNN